MVHRLKLLVMRVPPCGIEEATLLGLFPPRSDLDTTGPQSLTPVGPFKFPWCGQPRSRLIERWVVVESKFGMSWQSILPRAILDPSQAGLPVFVDS